MVFEFDKIQLMMQSNASFIELLFEPEYSVTLTWALTIDLAQINNQTNGTMKDNIILSDTYKTCMDKCVVTTR